MPSHGHCEVANGCEEHTAALGRPAADFLELLATFGKPEDFLDRCLGYVRHVTFRRRFKYPPPRRHAPRVVEDSQQNQLLLVGVIITPEFHQMPEFVAGATLEHLLEPPFDLRRFAKGRADRF